MSQVLIHTEAQRTLRRPMNQLCDLGVSAVNHLAGLRWNPLGIDAGETSVSKYMVRRRKPPSQTWRTFLENHLYPRAALRSPAAYPGRQRRSETRPPQSRSRLAACLRAAISFRRRGPCRIRGLREAQLFTRPSCCAGRPAASAPRRAGRQSTSAGTTSCRVRLSVRDASHAGTA